MARSIATVFGTAIVPGVSRNGRLYTPELIADAVTRAQERISAGDMTIVEDGQDGRPLTQRTHHAADDDSTQLVGRITSLTVDESTGAAKFVAVLADTKAGKDILALIDNSDGTPAYLRGVSIRGAWLGPVQRTVVDGRAVETASGLEIDGLDYTASPGVVGAQVERVVRAQSTNPSESAERVLIYESVQEAVVEPIEADTTGTPTSGAQPALAAPVAEAEPNIVEKGAAPMQSGKPAAAPTKAKRYADPGYQGDKAPRYALDTKSEAKAAWSYINQSDNAKNYTGPQLKRIRERIVKALRGYGVTVDTKERWLIEPAMVVSEALAECWDCEKPGSFYVSLTNGPVTVTVSSGCVDPADLDLIGRAAMDGACTALAQIDPDLDGDMDVPGAGAEDTDHDMSAANTAAPAVEAAPASTVSAASAADTIMNEKETVVTDASTTPAADAARVPDAAAPPVTLSADQFAQLLAAARGPNTAQVPAPVESVAPATEVAETEDQRIERIVQERLAAAPASVTETETAEQRVQRLVEERVAGMRQQIVQDIVESQGPPARKGVSRPVEDYSAKSTPTGLPEDWPDKPLSEYSDEERTAFFGPALRSYVLGDRA